MNIEVFTRLNKTNVDKLIIVKDVDEMKAHGFYGPYRRQPGDNNVPEIWYNESKIDHEMKCYVLQEEWDSFKERANKKAKEVLMSLAKKVEEPTEAPTDEEVEE